MANPEHLEMLRRGVDEWNRWYQSNCAYDGTMASLGTRIKPDLSHWDGACLREFDFTRFVRQRWGHPSELGEHHREFQEGTLSYHSLQEGWIWLSGAEMAGTNLQGATLDGLTLRDTRLVHANLSQASLERARLDGASLIAANLRSANLRSASLTHADLRDADLTDANLLGADLTRANLHGANLSGANLLGANLQEAVFVASKMDRTILSGCRVHGLAAWDLDLSSTVQKDLLITRWGEPDVVVDNIELAQFVYLLLRSDKIRDVINTIGDKGVLILGRFTHERKLVLDAIRDHLRTLGFVPMMFDFERPTQRDFTETIKTLAGLSRFIIADITNPKSSPLELQATMPDYMIPFVPIIQESEEPFAMFRDLQQKYGDWVLDVLRYDSVDCLLRVLQRAVIDPALAKSRELLLKKTEAIRTRHVKDYLLPPAASGGEPVEDR